MFKHTLKLMLFFFVLINITNSHAQNSKNKTADMPEKPVQQFNIEKYQQNKNRVGEYSFTLEDGTKVRQFECKDGYIEDISSPHSPYLYRNIYDPKGKFFQTHKKISSSGNW